MYVRILCFFFFCFFFFFAALCSLCSGGKKKDTISSVLFHRVKYTVEFCRSLKFDVCFEWIFFFFFVSSIYKVLINLKLSYLDRFLSLYPLSFAKKFARCEREIKEIKD